MDQLETQPWVSISFAFLSWVGCGSMAVGKKIRIWKWMPVRRPSSSNFQIAHDCATSLSLNINIYIFIHIHVPFHGLDCVSPGRTL